MISCEKIPYKDKGCHFIVGVLLEVLFINIFNPLIGIILVAIIAILKEEYDKYIKKTFIDIYDIVATVLGAFVIFIFNFILNSI